MLQINDLLLFFAAVVLLAVFFALLPRFDFLTFRRNVRRRKPRPYRAGFWIETHADTGAMQKAAAAALAREGLIAVPLHEQAATDLYRNTRWRDRIGFDGQQILDVVAVGRLREKATHDIGKPYAWILDFRYFYPRNGAQLSAGELSTYMVGPAGGYAVLAAKAAGEIVKAIWIINNSHPPRDPAYPYDTTSWPFDDPEPKRQGSEREQDGPLTVLL